MRDRTIRVEAARWGAAGLMLLLTILLSSTPAIAQGLIAFSCGDASANQQVCVMDLGSGFVRQLTFVQNHGLPSWSPDGRMLTYTRVIDDNHTAVGVMDDDGAGQRDVADYALNSTWSVTDKIAYVKTSGTGRCGKSIWVVNADGSDEHQVTCAGLNHDHTSPAWSPDGSQIAYIESSAVGGAAGLSLEAWVVGVDGTGARQITSPGNINFDAGGSAINAAESADALNWSAATGRIAFWSGVALPPNGPFGQVWTMNPDGSDRRQLTHEAGWNHDDTSWSPDGNYILFTRGNPNLAGITSELWVMGADGSNPQLLAPLKTGPLAGHSSWQPVGALAVPSNGATGGGDGAGAGSSAGDGGGGAGDGGAGDGGD